MKENMSELEQFFEREEVDFRELCRYVWSKKHWIILVAGLFAVISVIIAISLPNKYTSEALVVPAENKAEGGVSALASQFGGLASLAGINVGSSSSTSSDLAFEIIQSRKFIGEFITKRDILVELMAVDKWEQSSNTLVLDPELYDAEKREWVRKVKFPKKPKPSIQEATKAFKKAFDIKKDDDTGLITISIEHLSPIVAKKWVDYLVEDINSEMKERDVSEAGKSMQFLTLQIEKTSVAEIKSVLFDLIEEQTKTIMFSEIRDEYVFKTVDPAIVPEEKSQPRRALICIALTFLGLTGAILFFIVRYFFKSNSK